jgi:hypothetical protein
MTFVMVGRSPISVLICPIHFCRTLMNRHHATPRLPRGRIGRSGILARGLGLREDIMSKLGIAIFAVAIAAVGFWAFAGVSSDASMLQASAGIDPMAMMLGVDNLPQASYENEAI